MMQGPQNDWKRQSVQTSLKGYQEQARKFLLKDGCLTCICIKVFLLTPPAWILSLPVWMHASTRNTVFSCSASSSYSIQEIQGLGYIQVLKKISALVFYQKVSKVSVTSAVS